jgi:hypothetical protein
VAVLEQAFRSRLSVLTGRAGTGKTTVVEHSSMSSGLMLASRSLEEATRPEQACDRAEDPSTLRRGAAEFNNGMHPKAGAGKDGRPLAGDPRVGSQSKRKI